MVKAAIDTIPLPVRRRVATIHLVAGSIRIYQRCPTIGGKGYLAVAKSKSRARPASIDVKVDMRVGAVPIFIPKAAVVDERQK
jgi:hypothetical protein